MLLEAGLELAVGDFFVLAVFFDVRVAGTRIEGMGGWGSMCLPPGCPAAVLLLGWLATRLVEFAVTAFGGAA